MSRIDADIQKALDETGLPYEFVPGKKHVQIRLGGHLIGVLPGNGKDHAPRAKMNTVSQIRRKAKELKCQGR